MEFFIMASFWGVCQAFIFSAHAAFTFPTFFFPMGKKRILRKSLDCDTIKYCGTNICTLYLPYIP